MQEINLVPILVIGLLLCGTFVTVAAITEYATHTPSSVVQNPDTVLLISLYDQASGINLTSLYFGSLNRGESSSRLIEVYNDGNVPVTLVLSQPSQSFLHLSWDYDLQVIDAQGYRNIFITLAIDANAPSVSTPTTYNFDTAITAVIFE